MSSNKISMLTVLDRMVKDDNQGIALSKTIAEVSLVTQGAIVGFGIEKRFANDASIQKDLGARGENAFICLVVNREELEKTRKQMEDEL